mgnify:CR=1 FL=1
MKYKNPYGIYNEKLIHIENYKKEMGEVKCPVCKDVLVFCNGVEIKNYFRHKAGNIEHNEREYYGAVESIQHKEMKKQLIEKKEVPLRFCRWCKQHEEKRLEGYVEWKEEVKWEEFVIDIVCAKENNIIFIEVVNTHKCSNEKVKKFYEKDVIWMEIDCNGDYLRGNYSCKNCSVQIDFGKYKNRSVGEILLIDKNYCEWLLRESYCIKTELLYVLTKKLPNIKRTGKSLKDEYLEICAKERQGPKELIKMHKELKESFMGHYLYSRINRVSKGRIKEERVLAFGKHNGKNVYDVDKSYLRWLLDNFDKIENNVYGQSMTNLKFFIVDALLS